MAGLVDVDGAGFYLTNDVFLYRVVRVSGTGVDASRRLVLIQPQN
jgi:hypothetical protein